MTNLAPNKDDSQLEAEKLNSQFAIANGVRLHYVTSGSGEPVVLIHGYPETWYAWHKIIPTLAEKYTVIAPDLRGLGESDIAATGYDKRTVAEDVHQLLIGLGIERFMLVAHDMGVPVAYALANAYPETVACFVAIESGIPGFGLEQAMDVGKGGSWHFGFFMSEFAEMLTQGREKEFLTKFAFTGEFVYRKEAISQDDIETYVRDYSKPGRMSAGFAYYRAFKSDAKYNQENFKQKLKMPVLAIGAENSFGDFTSLNMKNVAENVTSVIIKDCGHFVAEEQPEELAAQLLSFFAQTQK